MRMYMHKIGKESDLGPYELWLFSIFLFLLFKNLKET